MSIEAAKEAASSFIVETRRAAKKLPGFNTVRLYRACFRENGKDGRIEPFVPVTKLPFDGDEGHGAWIIAINISKDAVPKTVKNWVQRVPKHRIS